MKRLVFFFIFAFVFFSCKKNNASPITLDAHDAESLSPDSKWALVIEPYAGFRENPSWDSKVLSYCKKGEIFLVQGSSPRDETTWIQFEKGFLPETSVSIYQNKYKAESAKKQLSK